MSDVLAYVRSGLLLTGLINPQVIHTAEMMDIIAICCSWQRPGDEIIELANDKHNTYDYAPSLYEACGMLYNAGLIGK